RGCLAWSGNPEHAQALEARARQCPSPSRANALLLAAVALGSRSALEEVRDRIARRSGVTGTLLEALACAGDDSDAETLVQYAADATEAPCRELAVMAVGHLGSPGVVPFLTRLRG